MRCLWADNLGDNPLLADARTFGWREYAIDTDPWHERRSVGVVMSKKFKFKLFYCVMVSLKVETQALSRIYCK